MHQPGHRPLHSVRLRGRDPARWRTRKPSISPTRGTYHLPALLLVLLIVIQSFEPHMCRELMRHTSDERSKDKPLSTTDGGRAPHEVTLPQAKEHKRAAERSAPSQPEEIFSAPADDSGLSYDEYPMVVPKRAALLLDRLMVALHHALEQERAGHRIGDFYADKSNLNEKFGEPQNGLAQQPAGEDGMYTEDDPSVLLDYDFKDVNQINRATGETLMAKSFQRRAGAELAGEDRSGTSSLSASPAGPRRLHPSGPGGGRMYWRCYFNAVSCF
ncbi:hypothetical protein KR074_002913 [Drosophila pseudoananassae]|nr:hypothetical protein KR074_002913 [Drosophila pseudoananassae]